MKTKAAILTKTNAPLEIDEVETPRLKRGQLLVKILYSGVCRAQWNEIIALKGPDRFLPHLLGHEATGIIEELGPGVTKVKPGDYVILSWIKGKGLDGVNSQYRRGSELVNAGGVTTFSGHSVVSENRVTKISRKMPADIACIIGCAVATGCGIVYHTFKAKKGDSIAVFGVGGVGSSALLAAKSRKCYPIIAVDVSSYKLRHAKNLGASHVVNAKGKDAIKKIFAICRQGIKFAIDASGTKPAMEMAFASLEEKGTLVIAGNLPKDQKIELHPFELIKGKKILGSWGGETVPDRDYPRYVRAYLKGELALDQLITHRFKLDEINEAFHLLINGQAGRIILKNSNGAKHAD